MTACLGNTSNPPFATGVDAFVYPQFIGYAMRTPTTKDIYNPGTRWQDNSVNPAVIYETTGAGNWLAGGDNPATTTTFGTVKLSTLAQLEGGTAPSGAYVPLANDVFTYVQSVVLGGANIAQTSVTGIVNLATNAQAVAGTATIPGVTALAVQPSNLASVFASPPAIGGTAPAAGTFTTLTNVGTASINASGTAATTIGGSSGAITIATGAGNFSLKGNGNTVGIANDSAANLLTIGSTNGAASLTLQSGTGGMSLATGATTPGLFAVTPDTASTASATTTVTLNSRVLCTTWTGFTTASGSAQAFTIVSSLILATSCIFVTVTNLNASTNAALMTLISVTQSAGQIVVQTKNNGAGALGAGDNVLINVWVLS